MFCVVLGWVSTDRFETKGGCARVQSLEATAGSSSHPDKLLEPKGEDDFDTVLLPKYRNNTTLLMSHSFNT